MKNIFYLILVISAVISSCSKKVENYDARVAFGNFNGKNVLLKPVDYMKTPVSKKIEHHPELFTHLNDIEILSMAYNSDSLMISGFVVQPKKPGKYPVIVFNRGGHQELGRLVVATAVEVMGPFAAEGFVVVASNYRGNSGSEGKEEFGGSDVRDNINLISHLHEIGKADTNNINLLGISRGGMMNYLTLKNYTGDKIKASAAIGGVSDLEITLQHHPEMEGVYQELIPDYNEKPKKVLQARSANYWVNELPDIPYLILHSNTDDHVHYSQALILADSLKYYDRKVNMQIFENDSHGLTNNREIVLEKIIEFFKEVSPAPEF
ncbi:peptidase [Marivirga tractuosa]|uniref:Peptidase n=1 Tax=Marivirga tractuosa (strain ATCC 23168 / DSM 4126 / NBRC 15989 / NCIMB 1408 / VKM B-1430 / H-43) TaxID=643867 RepID=E4TM13_MARTH|nr:prolyl oligopeptidase family serine peptidase [Marivirga tractuosa]ADR20304.1 peptidase [Marivirga tractuosa DSM 4126]BDD15254.1 peptidase [Marivirga tractuosa]